MEKKKPTIQDFYDEYVEFQEELKAKGITSRISFKEFCEACGYK